jgi:uncharacterized damage-inducible protein DinB
MLRCMLETQVMREILSAGASGDAWYGSSTADVLSGLDASGAARHVEGYSHSVWELLLHSTGWMEEVARRLAGHEPSPPPDGDWPALAAATESDWAEAQRRFQAAAAELGGRMAAFDADRWTAMVGDARAQALGTGVTFAAMVVGVIQHNAYHTGQMALVRKALER